MTLKWRSNLLNFPDELTSIKTSKIIFIFRTYIQSSLEITITTIIITFILHGNPKFQKEKRQSESSSNCWLTPQTAAMGRAGPVQVVVWAQRHRPSSAALPGHELAVGSGSGAVRTWMKSIQDAGACRRWIILFYSHTNLYLGNSSGSLWI